MVVTEKLEHIVQESKLTFEEQRAFLLGLSYLSDEEKDQFIQIVKDNTELIYPLYINFKAKLHSMKDAGTGWETIVEDEIKEFERLLGDKA
jgi:hypothetical protein